MLPELRIPTGPHQEPRFPLPSSRRRYTSSARRSLPATDRDNGTTETKNLSSSASVAQPANIDSNQQQATTPLTQPWYLRLQEAEFKNNNPILARQELPDIPYDAPPILESVVQHLSVQIGLDYLSLLDLRNLDPPPALGANLVMLVGTARSEKHLNVSADRFCRWLRTEHKLSPYADGLLGRNELKLKMRRKLRRSKMLSAVGAKEIGDTDDGIATGWICVNVGAVDAAEQVEEELGEGAVGFGRSGGGTNVVVQMMTEDKRGDIDLEGLWQGVRRRSFVQQKATQVDPVDPEQTTPEDARDLQSFVRQSNPIPSPTVSHGFGQQVRPYHTTSRRRADDLSAQDTELRASAGPNYNSNALGPPTMILDEAIANGDSTPPKGSVLGLGSHLDRLSKLSDEEALISLGLDEDDRTSTEFLRSFYQQLPPLLESGHWEALLALHSCALMLGHPGYTQSGHADLLRRAMASSHTLPVAAMQSAFDTVLFSNHIPGAGGRKVFDLKRPRALRLQAQRLWRSGHDPGRSKNTDPHLRVGHHALRSSLGIAFNILEYMEAYGHNVCTVPTLLSLHTAISSPQFADDASGEQPPALSQIQVARMQYHYRQALDVFYTETSNIPYAVLVAMLKTYGSGGSWRNFWRVWRGFAEGGLPRNAHLYTIMFNAVANSHKIDKARSCLVEAVEEMKGERPGIRVEKDGELALAIFSCLRVAAYDNSSEKGRWSGLLNECRQGLQLLPEDRTRAVLEEFGLTEASSEGDKEALFEHVHA